MIKKKKNAQQRSGTLSSCKSLNGFRSFATQNTQELMVHSMSKGLMAVNGNHVEKKKNWQLCCCQHTLRFAHI